MHAPTIKPLTAGDAARVRSTVVITSLADVVLGLVKNSLDAGATNISLCVDMPRGRCEIEDDGHGIADLSFTETGGLLKQHWTSKAGLSHVHGRHGLFLAAVADVASLTIASSQHASTPQASLTAQFSMIISRKLPENGKQNTSDLPGRGTRVSVRDLFANMPVRVKQRDMLADEIDTIRPWAVLHGQLVALLMAWRAFVTLRVLDGSQRCRMAIKHPRLPGTPSKSAVGDRPTQLDYIWSVLLQAELVHCGSRPSWVPLAASNSTWKIRGAISLDPSPSRDVQFISFGIMSVTNDGNNNELFCEVNRIFGNSAFGTIVDEMTDAAVVQRRLTDKRFKQDGYTDRTLHSGQRGVDRWPMFVLNISKKSDVPGDLSESATPNDGEQLSRVLDLIGATITQWLSEQHLHPHKWESRQQRSRYREAQRPVTATMRTETPFVDRVTGGSDAARPASRKRPLSQSSPSGNMKITSISSRPASADTTLDCQAGVGDHPYHTWIHPLTKQKHLIDARSGAVLPYQEASLTAKHSLVELSVARAYQAKSLRLETKPRRDPPSHPSQWIQAVINKWDNPVFAPCETGIEQISAVDLENRVLPGPCSHKDSASQRFDVRGRSTLESSITIQDLQHASVIAQLDTKFILLQVQLREAPPDTIACTHTQTSLVIVDQHAADERVKVEALLSSLIAGLDVITLVAPLSFELAAKERPLFVCQAKYFAQWGILYVLDIADGSASTTATADIKLTVNTLPSGIAERCSREPRILLELLRAEVWKRTEDGGTMVTRFATPEVATTDRHSWLRSMGNCPTGLLDMINSRACRSALMFNDELSLPQCKDLISKLASCALPFQCAHGRPSMVPLTGLGAAMNTHCSQYDHGEQDGKDVGFAAAYRSWRHEKIH